MTKVRVTVFNIHEMDIGKELEKATQHYQQLQKGTLAIKTERCRDGKGGRDASEIGRATG
jgi:hypothetical protein